MCLKKPWFVSWETVTCVSTNSTYVLGAVTHSYRTWSLNKLTKYRYRIIVHVSKTGMLCIVNETGNKI